MAKNKTNKERLICIESKVDAVITGLENHLEDHKRLYSRLFKLFLVVIGITGTAVTSVIIVLLTK